MNEITCNEVGTLEGGAFEGQIERQKRVYGTDGLSPALIASVSEGGSNGVKILESVKDTPEDMPCVWGGTGDLKSNNGTQFYQQDRIYDAEHISPAVPAQLQGGMYNFAIYDEQNEYIRTDGTVGALSTDGSSPKHNNRVIELGDSEPLNPMPDGTCRTIKSQYQNSSRANFERQSTFGATGVKTGIKVRKLTPKECWRLMDFDDSDFEKAEKVCSSSQLYKQAGNSIVVKCLEFIFREML